MPRYGIDVSHHDGQIDLHAAFAFLAAKSSGTPFLIAKLTEGTDIIDAQSEHNILGGKSVGFEVAAYHFGRADLDGTQQGQHYADAVQPYVDQLGITMSDGAVVKGFFDLEDDDNNHASRWEPLGLRVAIPRVGHALVEMDAVLGSLTGIYTSPGWFNGVFGNTDWSHRVLWEAIPGHVSPVSCGAWGKNAGVLQYSWTGTVDGVDHAKGTDLDVLV